jgi:hypothetical protein
VAYSYYRSITIDHTQVSASSSTYLRVPVFGNASFATVANGGRLTNSSGYDLIFSTASDGSSPLTFELEENSYNAVTGAGLWWVRIPFPSTSVDTVFYACYGNAAITTYQGNTNGTWGTDYDAVVHFNASGSQIDSTATGNNLTSTGGSPSYTAGLLGLAFTSGGSDYLYQNPCSGINSDGPCTLSAWYKLASATVTGNVCIVGMGGNGTTNCRALALPGAATFVVDTATVDPACALASSTNWVYMTIVVPTSGTPNNMLVYLNGILQTTAGGNNTAFALTSAGSYFTVGCIPGAPGAGGFMAGLIDELRYAPSALDAGLIATDYAAQQPSTTFYGLGTEHPIIIGSAIQVQQVVIELQAQTNPSAQVQQVVLELMTINSPAARIQQVVFEMQVLPAPAPIPPTPPQPGRTGGLPYGVAPVLQNCQCLNQFDECELEEIRKMRAIKFPPMCIMPKGLDPYQMPWDEDYGFLPKECVPFNRTGGVVTPTTASGDNTVLSFRVPEGYDGLLSGTFWGYSGTGFSQGSGDLIFRIKRNLVYLKDLSNVPFLLGSPQLPVAMTQGAFLLSGQVVSLIVNVPNLSGSIQVGASTIFGGLLGFWWPRG